MPIREFVYISTTACILFLSNLIYHYENIMSYNENRLMAAGVTSFTVDRLRWLLPNVLGRCGDTWTAGFAPISGKETGLY